jgi:hypothetical protein
MKALLTRLLVLLLLTARARTEEISARWPEPALDRWMYSFNATPGVRPRAPVFGTFGDAAGVDTRHAQFLVGFDTTNQIPAGLGLTRYLVRRAVFEATLGVGDAFVLDPTADLFGSFFPTNDPRHEPDDDPGRPVELFAAGFRGGFTDATFPEDGPHGGSGPAGRNAYAAGFNTAAELVDVSNNVGKTNAAFAPFPVEPFAVGTVTNLAAGELVPLGARMRFELNLADPRVRGWLLRALAAGRLRLTLSSFHGGTLGGQPAYPDFTTRENLLYDAPSLELVATLVGPEDTDADGLPDDWERFHFGHLDHGATADPDGDGVDNARELAAGSDPADAASHPRLRARREAGGLAIQWPWLAARAPVLETSADGVTWRPVTAARTVSPAGVAEVLVPVEAGPAALFRVRYE